MLHSDAEYNVFSSEIRQGDFHSHSIIVRWFWFNRLDFGNVEILWKCTFPHLTCQHSKFDVGPHSKCQKSKEKVSGRPILFNHSKNPPNTEKSRPVVINCAPFY